MQHCDAYVSVQGRVRRLYLLRRIPAPAVPRLSRQQEVRASQRVHGGIRRLKVRQVRRFRYDTLPALLKGTPLEGEPHVHLLKLHFY